MPRYLKIGAAQVGPNQDGTPRECWNFLGRRQPEHYGHLLQPVTEKEPNR
jgi:hypothetical protein